MIDDYLIKNFGIEIAIQKIAPQIAEKIKLYKEKKDKNIEKELLELINDREKIYSNDKETIEKYLKNY